MRIGVWCTVISIVHAGTCNYPPGAAIPLTRALYETGDAANISK